MFSSILCGFLQIFFYTLRSHLAADFVENFCGYQGEWTWNRPNLLVQYFIRIFDHSFGRVIGDSFNLPVRYLFLSGVWKNMRESVT